MISYTETPTTEISDPVIERAGLRLLIKHEYLNHHLISGNKWWKLKYNLERARELGHERLLTFGGAYSNHLFAVAAAAKEIGISSVGIVRGEKTLPLNPTLEFASKCGMEIHYLDRNTYKEKSGDVVLKQLSERFGNFYLIPEGGTNAEAIKGCVEFGEKLKSEIAFDFIVVPVGTGGTLAGLIQSLAPGQQAIGVSVLKNGSFLSDEVGKWLPAKRLVPWRIETRFDFGGYARTTPELGAFIEGQYGQHKIPLDHVYTGKALFAVLAMIEAGEFPRGTTVLMVHTGGLQGSV